MKTFLKYLSVSILSLMVVGTGFAIWKSGSPSEVVFKSIKATLNGLTSGTPYFQVTGGRVMDGNNYPYLTGDSLTGNALTNTSLTDKYIPFYSGNIHNLKNSNMYLSGTETISSGNFTITGGNAITFTEGKELKVNMGEEKGMIVQSAFESANVGIGHWVLRSMYNNAQLNTAIGARAMWRLTSGLRNTAVGGLALGGVTVGTDNTAVGIYASQSTTNGSYNVSVGDESLYYNTGGSQNTALGMGAGEYSYGSKNVFLGHFADVRTTTVGGTTTGLNLTNAIAIGDSAKVWTSNMMQLGNTGNGFISTNWNLGIGVSNPTNALSVSGNINVTTGYNIYDGLGNAYLTGVSFTGLSNGYIPTRSGNTFVNSNLQYGNTNLSIGTRNFGLTVIEGISIGLNTQVNNKYGIAIGTNSVVNGFGAMSLLGGNANNTGSIAMLGAGANGVYSFGLGWNSIAGAYGSVAMQGGVVTGSADYGFALGLGVKTNSPYGFNIGHFNLGLTNSIFEIGYGLSGSSLNNAVTVLNNGYMGIGTSNPQYTLDISGSIQSNNSYYLTGGTTQWKISVSGDNLSFQAFTGGIWVEKGFFTP